MKFCFHANTVDWLDVKLDMKPVDHYMIDGAIDIGLQLRGFYKENKMGICYPINEEVVGAEIIE